MRQCAGGGHVVGPVVCVVAEAAVHDQCGGSDARPQLVD
jgi:hypothetical protein